MSKNLLNLFNIIFPLLDFLYILQLEEYDNARFSKTMVRFWLRRNIQKRDSLKFTSRIQTTSMLSVGLIILTGVTLYLIRFSLFILLIPLLIPLFVLMSNMLLTSFYEFMKYRLQLKARSFVMKHNPMQVIAIAGSYGKTTTKNFLYELLKYNYKVQMVPGNINTPTGIAAWILKNLETNTEVLLVEMDTYFLGEIKRSCMITPPTISVITSIGDQHVERFGSKKKMAEAILEVFTCASPHAKFFTFENEIKNLQKLNVNYPKNIHVASESKLRYKTNIVSKTGQKDLLMAFTISNEFSIPVEIIKDTFLHLTHPDRRQKLVTLHGYDAIDDSYNISYTTALAAVKELQSLGVQKKKKTIVITAGIPELGKENREANTKYGLFLKKNVDQVIVLNSIYKEEVFQKGFIVAENLAEAWKKIEDSFSSKKFAVLVQPELTDLYYNS